MKGNLLTPLSIVLAFIGVIEATLAYRVTDLKDSPHLIFVWFMVLFPTLVLGGFFYVQITNPVSWYPPSELDKASIDRLKLLGKKLPKLVSLEVVDPTAPSGSRTIGQEASLNDEALLAFEKGQYEKAIRLFESSIKEKKGKKSVPLSDIASTKLNLGASLSSLGRYQEAEQVFKEALKLYQQIGDQNSTSIVYNNLGSVYKNMGDYNKAIELYQRSLEINQRLGADHPETAANLNNLASVYFSKGDLDKSEILFKKSLEIYQAVYGSEHPKTATAINNLAAVYAARGNLDKALLLYKESLSLNEKVFGPEHPRTATAISNLASVYRELGRYDEALVLYKKALNIMEITLGKDHPNTETIKTFIKEIGSENS